MELSIVKKKKGVQYFTQDTEDAIVAYNNTSDYVLKNRIYERHIHKAFRKLAENIIHTFKFYYTEVDKIEDLQHEVEIFLFTKMYLYDQTKGAKAYSYFGTIAKRYLILSNQKNYKKRIDALSINTLEEDENHSYVIEDVSNDEYLSVFIDEFVNYCTENIFNLFPKEYDAQIADAILELFRKRENLDVFNKKALYIYIREQVDAKTPKITKIANQLYNIFEENYIFYLEHGYISF